MDWEYTVSEELSNRLLEIKEIESISSAEYEKAVKNYIQLYKIGLEEAKMVNDFQNEELRQKTEREFREKELKMKTIDQYITIGKCALEIIFYGVVPVIVSVKLAEEGFKFEQEGYYTSYTFKELLKSVFKIKR